MSRRGVLLFAAMSIIWGVPYLLIKVAVDDLGPIALVAARTGIGAALLVPVAVARRQLRPVLARWRPLLVYTVVELALPWLLLSVAEQRLPSSVAALLIAAVPLIGTAVVWILGERGSFGLRSATGLLIGLAGVAALVGFDIGGAELPSVLMVLGVATGYAVGPVIFVRTLADVSQLGVAAASLAICAVVFAPLAVATRPAATPSSGAIWSVVALGSICTALAFMLFFALISEIGPVRATVITYVNPAVAVVLGVVFLDEAVGLATAAGFVFVLAGSVLATASRAPAPAFASPSAALVEAEGEAAG